MFRQKRLSKGLIFTVSASILSAVWIVITRFLLVHGENPLNLTAWIVSLTALPWLFLLQKHRSEVQKLSRKNIGLLIFIGIASSLGINYLQALSLANTPAINFSFLYRTIIIFTIIFAAIFFKEKITLKKGLLVFIILIGSFLLATNGTSIHFTKGDIYTLMMAASGAFVANILVKHTISQMHTDVSGAITTIVASISLIILAVFTHVFRIPQNFWLILVGSAFYFVHIMFRNRSYKHASASFVTLVFALAPFYVSILSVIFLGESLTPIECIGGLLIVGSVFFVDRLKI